MLISRLCGKQIRFIHVLNICQNIFKFFFEAVALGAYDTSVILWVIAVT